MEIHSFAGRNDASRRPVRARRWLTALLLFQVSIATTIAGTLNTSMESSLSIREAARSFIAKQIVAKYPHNEIRISDLDPRLQLTACDSPLQGFLPPGGHLLGNTTIGVRCAGSKPWTVYLPAVITGMRQVVVTKRPILRGSAISQEDIVLEERELTNNGNAYIFSPSHVLGKIAKRPLRPAMALAPSMLAEPLLVHRGQQIIILAQGIGIEVRMKGTALMNGAEGQLVRAKNARSNRIIEGQVVKPGIIKVNM